MNAERTYAFLTEDLKTTQDLLVNTRIQRDALESSYRTRRESRVGEIKVVQQAYDLLSAHAEKIAAQE